MKVRDLSNVMVKKPIGEVERTKTDGGRCIARTDRVVVCIGHEIEVATDSYSEMESKHVS